MDRSAPLKNPEAQLLREIGELSDRVRGLRLQSAPQHSAQIKELEQTIRAKWDHLRTLRVTPNSQPPERGSTSKWR